MREGVRIGLCGFSCIRFAPSTRLAQTVLSSVPIGRTANLDVASSSMATVLSQTSPVKRDAEWDRASSLSGDVKP